MITFLFNLKEITNKFLFSLVRHKQGGSGGGEGGGGGGGGGRGGRMKKGRIDIYSDARCRCSHRSNSVRGVGYEEKEKT